MSSLTHSYPPANGQIYRSAYSGGMVSDEKGKFHHFIRQPTQIHELNGYWRFSSFKDDQCAYRRGFATPEEILVAQDHGDASFDDITLTWLPGKNDSTNGKVITGTPAAHLETIYNERRAQGKFISLRGCIPFYPIADDEKLQTYRAQRYLDQNGTQHRLMVPPVVTQPSSSSSASDELSSNAVHNSGLQHAQVGSLLGRTRSSTRIAKQKQLELSMPESTQEGDTVDCPVILSPTFNSTLESEKKTSKAKTLPTLKQNTNATPKTTERWVSTELPTNQNWKSAGTPTSQRPLQRPALPPMQGLRGVDWNTRSLGSLPPANQRVSYYGNPFDNSHYQQRPNPSCGSGIPGFANPQALPVAFSANTAPVQPSVTTLSDMLRTTYGHSRRSDALPTARESQVPVGSALLQTDFSRQTFSVKADLRGGGRGTDSKVSSPSRHVSKEHLDEAANISSDSIVLDMQNPKQSQTLDILDMNTAITGQSNVSKPVPTLISENVDASHRGAAQSIEHSEPDSSGRTYSMCPDPRDDASLHENFPKTGLDVGPSTSRAGSQSSKADPTGKDSSTSNLRPADGSSRVSTPSLTPNKEDTQSKDTHGLDEQDFAPFYFAEELNNDEATPGSADPYSMLPCMDCEQIGEHRWDCHIGHVDPVATVTMLDYRNLAEEVQRFDPGPFIGENWHVGPPKESEPEDISAQIKGMADIIRNEDSFQDDPELQMLPDQLMILLWAMKTSVGVEVIQQ